MDYTKYSLLEVSSALRTGEVTSESLTLACLNKIEEEKDINALNSVCREQALEMARKVDKMFSEGKQLPLLAGIPVVIKDNINYKGTKTTCSSKLLENYVSPYNATVVEKLLENYAVIIGKANMDEFAMGSSNENSAFGNVLNPINKEYVPGGSSGGSCACVKACECYASLGTDTGGSIRQPASFCGVVGLKPTYSRVSRYGVVAFASSLDQVGPVARTSKDCAVMLNAIAGYDEKENTSSKVDVPNYLECIKGSVKGLKIGIAKEFFELNADDDVRKCVNDAIEMYKKNGAEIVDVTLPHIKNALSVYYVLSSAEATSNLGRYDGVRYGRRADDFSNLVDLYVKSRTEGFGKEVKRRIMLGNFVLSSGYYDAYYKKAQKVQELLIAEFDEAFKKCDVLMCPTSPTVAFKFGEKTNDPLKMYLSDIYTVPVNIVGSPSISVPCGKGKNGLPVGLQIIGKKFDEGTLLNTADFLEEHFYKEDR